MRLVQISIMAAAVLVLLGHVCVPSPSQTVAQATERSGHHDGGPEHIGACEIVAAARSLDTGAASTALAWTAHFTVFAPGDLQARAPRVTREGIAPPSFDPPLFLLHSALLI